MWGQHELYSSIYPTKELGREDFAWCPMHAPEEKAFRFLIKQEEIER